MPDKTDGRYEPAIRCITWIARLVFGGVFIFSGFVKAIDPWGSIYKFEEYASALGVPAVHALLVIGVFGLCALEFCIGVFTVLGCYRRSCPIVATIFMCVMLPLTLWIAISDPVKDCGCFGDYLRLSNWATFWKNVVLMAMAIWLVKYNRRCLSIISPAFQWIGCVLTLAFTFCIMFLGYTCQPLLDFRAYPVGSAITPHEEDDRDEPEFVFVYERNGERIEVGVDDEIPDESEGWKFVERIEKTTDSEAMSIDAAKEQTFRIWDRRGENDETDEVLVPGENLILLLIPELGEVSPATTWKINALHDWAEERGIAMSAVVAGTEMQLVAWEETAMPDYPIYTADDTAIKEVARGNPAVVYIDNGVVEWKNSLGSIDVDKMLAEGDAFEPSAIITDGKGTLHDLLYLYLICMAVPVTMSFLPRIRNAFYRKPHDSENSEISENSENSENSETSETPHS